MYTLFSGTLILIAFFFLNLYSILEAFNLFSLCMQTQEHINEKTNVVVVIFKGSFWTLVVV